MGMGIVGGPRSNYVGPLFKSTSKTAAIKGLAIFVVIIIPVDRQLI